LAATKAHAKVRRVAELEAAETALNATPQSPTRDTLTDILPAELVKWLPAIVLQILTLFGTFAAAIPMKPRNAPPPSPPTHTAEPARVVERSTRPQPRSLVRPEPAKPVEANVVATVAALRRDPDKCPPGLGVDAEGWLAGPQRKLATLLGVPVSAVNRELKQAAVAGMLELDTSGPVTRMRETTTRH
jgi:hypothetical protein